MMDSALQPDTAQSPLGIPAPSTGTKKGQQHRSHQGHQQSSNSHVLSRWTLLRESRGHLGGEFWGLSEGGVTQGRGCHGLDSNWTSLLNTGGRHRQPGPKDGFQNGMPAEFPSIIQEAPSLTFALLTFHRPREDWEWLDSPAKQDFILCGKRDSAQGGNISPWKCKGGNTKQLKWAAQQIYCISYIISHEPQILKEC